MDVGVFWGVAWVSPLCVVLILPALGGWGQLAGPAGCRGKGLFFFFSFSPSRDTGRSRLVLVTGSCKDWLGWWQSRIQVLPVESLQRPSRGTKGYMVSSQTSWITREQKPLCDFWREANTCRVQAGLAGGGSQGASWGVLWSVSSKQTITRWLTAVGSLWQALEQAGSSSCDRVTSSRGLTPVRPSHTLCLFWHWHALVCPECFQKVLGFRASAGYEEISLG